MQSIDLFWLYFCFYSVNIVASFRSKAGEKELTIVEMKFSCVITIVISDLHRLSYQAKLSAVLSNRSDHQQSQIVQRN